MSSLPFVSVLMPVRNEARHIKRSLGAVLAQDYPPERMEVLLIEGTSTDGSREIVQQMIDPQRRTVQTLSSSGKSSLPASKVIDNPARIVPAGLNRGIRRARGEIIVRVDGHTVIAPDYVRQCVHELARTDAANVGGRMTARGEGLFGEAVALASSTAFGVGGARFHYSDRREWVDTAYMGAWPREVFEKIGLFDEELVRDQDDELSYRLRAHGGRILLSPRLRSEYTARSSARGLGRQYFEYGFWKVRVAQKHPRQMRLRQFVPPMFVACLALAAILAALTPLGRLPLLLIAGSYGAANLAASVWAASGRGWKGLPLLPVAYAIMHLSYGLGFLMGLVRFALRWRDRHGRVPSFGGKKATNPEMRRLRKAYALRDQADQGHDRYTYFNPGHLFMVQSRQRAVLRLLRRAGFERLRECRLLELGCGSGSMLLECLTYGADPARLHGTDLLPLRLAQARDRLPASPLSCSNGEHLPYASGSFDLVLQFTAFTSILDPRVKANLAQEMLRVLRRPHGAILWYDFWLNPFNHHTRGIRPAEIRSLFPGCRFTFQRITLAPPVARRLAPLSSIAAALMEKLGFLNSHYLALIRPQPAEYPVG